MIAVLLAYLLGSLSFAVLVSRVTGLPDPRTHGSGNPGATNMLRTGRKGAALATLTGDLAKGWLAVTLASYMYHHGTAPVWAVNGSAVAVLVGHMFPVFFGFKGGKGVATALGVLLAVSPLLGAAIAAVWLLVFGLTRVSSLAALTAAGAAPVIGYLVLGKGSVVLALLSLSALIIWRHRANIARLASGQEGRFIKK